MSRKRDLVYTEFYAPYLSGGNRTANNPQNNEQAQLERMFVRILSELCMNRFEWTGLPEEIDPRFLELTLTYRALAVFYKDDDSDKFVTAQGSGAGHTNFMDHPVTFNVIGPGIGAGQSKLLSAVATRDRKTEEQKPPQCVPIWANYLRCPDLDIITIYANKLAKADRSIEITMDNMRKSKLVAANENERLSYMNAIRQIMEGQDTIFTVANAFDPAAIQVLDLGIDPLTLPNLQIARSKLWSECMGLLGINNANQDKKERLVSAEVGANDEQVQATKNIALNARQQACEQINKLYDINIWVDYKKEPESDADGDTETQSDNETPSKEGDK